MNNCKIDGKFVISEIEKNDNGTFMNGFVKNKNGKFKICKKIDNDTEINDIKELEGKKIIVEGFLKSKNHKFIYINCNSIKEV